MILSTCASDLVLALCCTSFALWLVRQDDRPRRYGAVGMALMAFASLLGALRYGGVEQLAPLHVGASHLAGAVAPPSFALVALVLRGRVRGGDTGVLGGGVLALVLAWVLFDLVLSIGPYRTGIGTLAVLAMLGIALTRRTRPAWILAIGALALALAGLVIGTKGTLGPFLAIDVFHLVLALAHGLIAAGLVGLQRDS